MTYTLEEFYNLQNKNTTKKNYKSRLTSFFKTINQEPEQFLSLPIESIEKTIMNFIQNEENKKRTPSTRRSYYNAISQFLLTNNIQLRHNFIKQIRHKINGKAQIEKIIFTREELIELFSQGDIETKALFMTALSSGMRINEILKLTIDDIDFNEEPPKISIPANITKSNTARFTFITPETKEILQLWINKHKSKYIQNKIGKNFSPKLKYYKNYNNNLIFPFKYETARVKYETLLKKADFIKKSKNLITNRYIHNIHSLRKYFETSLIDNGVPNIIVDKLIGHDENNLTNTYYAPSYETIKENYKKAIEKLTIQNISPNTKELKKQQTNTNQEIDRFKKQLEQQKKRSRINMLKNLEYKMTD